MTHRLNVQSLYLPGDIKDSVLRSRNQ